MTPTVLPLATARFCGKKHTASPTAFMRMRFPLLCSSLLFSTPQQLSLLPTDSLARLEHLDIEMLARLQHRDAVADPHAKLCIVSARMSDTRKTDQP